MVRARSQLLRNISPSRSPSSPRSSTRCWRIGTGNAAEPAGEEPSREASGGDRARLKGELAALRSRPTKIKPASLRDPRAFGRTHRATWGTCQNRREPVFIRVLMEIGPRRACRLDGAAVHVVELGGDWTKFGRGANSAWGSLQARWSAATMPASTGRRPVATAGESSSTRPPPPSLATHAPTLSDLPAVEGTVGVDGASRPSCQKGAFRGNGILPAPERVGLGLAQDQLDVEGPDQLSVGVLGKVPFEVVLEADSIALRLAASRRRQAPTPVTPREVKVNRSDRLGGIANRARRRWHQSGRGSRSGYLPTASAGPFRRRISVGVRGKHPG